MPLNLSSSVSPPPNFAGAPHAARLGAWVEPMVVALGGSALLGGLAAAGRADPAWAAAAAALLAMLGAGLSFRRRRAQVLVGGAVVAGPSPVATRDEAEMYVLALERAPAPMLLVTAEDIDDAAGRRVLFANAEAREVLRIGQDRTLLLRAIRHPGVLEAIDESLFGRISRTVTYEEGGPQARFWRVWTKPMPLAASRAERLALVVMRDETEARRNERMRADFLANASHELRTPLASLTGFIETLRGHAREDPVARERFLGIMSRQAGRMAQLIDDLLSLSRIELNEHVRPSGRFDLALAVSDVIDALAPQIAAKAVKLDLHLPPRGEAVIAGDREQGVQVVQNLLDNAVKYAPRDSVVRVEVTAGLSLAAAGASRTDDPRLGAPDGGRMSLLTPVRATSNSDYVLLRVEDKGCGMAREHLPRLAERFYRVEGQGPERAGTGLGLAIVKHIANRHRGGFYVESAPDRGSAFGIYLPMAPAPAEVPDLAFQTSPRRESSSLDTKVS